MMNVLGGLLSLTPWVFGQQTKSVPPILSGTAVADPPRFNRDDTFYPIETLQRYADAGMDVSQLRVANVMEGDEGRMPVRGLQVVNEWSELTADGLIGLCCQNLNI